MMLRRLRRLDSDGLRTRVNGTEVVCDPAGVLFLPDTRTLIVADLHLEKGAAFARRGMLLPPYDTGMTLALLKAVIDRFAPKTVVCLGDSFHDRRGAEMMPPLFRQSLTEMMAGREWIWISGNHDPEPPVSLGGDHAAVWRAGTLTFRHEPSAAYQAGEVAGHLHPVARVAGRGRSVRGACFASDGARMILPSFGVTTGGLNVLDRAFSGLLRLEQAMAYVIGTTRVFPIAFNALVRG
ncbi:ligase-associated DNA damage response endonuclease PdeM [Consotaella aegiceratis]|uniref:ligase-associated DNA damage response endonuclease PdeM n=1 Tax=Consotaella aegiceratis TaxID=3097961 RepID=UPI003D803873